MLSFYCHQVLQMPWDPNIDRSASLETQANTIMSHEGCSFSGGFAFMLNPGNLNASMSVKIFCAGADYGGVRAQS